MKPTPTKRFVIDSGRLCQAHCLFCYHAFKSMQGYKSLGEMIKEIVRGVDRGNNYMDITGGEPLLIPYIDEVVEYAHAKNIKACIITNGIINDKTIDKILATNIDDFLISIHGLEPIHNKLVGVENAFVIQKHFVERIKEKTSFRVNCVLNKHNQDTIVEFAKYLATLKPWVVNFINFNPHYEWASSDSATSIIADLKKLEPILNQAIGILEESGIVVNVRYYPMCRIGKEYRRCISNDLQVAFELFDPVLQKDIQCEWDYEVFPKTYEKYIEWSRNLSCGNEEKGTPCNLCGLQWICGGVNKYFNL